MAPVYIAVGHGRQPGGRHDPGTRDPASGAAEHEVANEVAGHVVRRLRDRGVDVDHEVDQDDPNYVGTTRAVNAGNYACVVSIHLDWYRNEDPGLFVLYTSDAGEGLGAAIVGAVRRAGQPVHARPLHRRTDLYLLNRTRPPAVIVEVSPIDRVRDNAAKGRAIADGIADHLGAPPATSLARPTPQPPAEAAWYTKSDSLCLRAVAYQLGVDFGSVIDPPDREAIVQALRDLVP